jgi:hypothetical protein
MTPFFDEWAPILIFARHETFSKAMADRTTSEVYQN